MPSPVVQVLGPQSQLRPVADKEQQPQQQMLLMPQVAVVQTITNNFLACRALRSPPEPEELDSPIPSLRLCLKLLTHRLDSRTLSAPYRLRRVE